MPTCPNCKQPITQRDLTCPTCRIPLKAFGHQGIDLYRSSDEMPLCETCTYHLDDTCNFPNRPLARECTLYRDIHRPETLPQPRSQSRHLRSWLQQHAGWVAIGGLLLISLVLVLLRH